MPRYIVQAGPDEFFEWSTIVDAPVTYAMSREEFSDYYTREYGRVALSELPRRMERVNKFGTSYRGGMSPEDLVAGNRAGPNESEATWVEICALVRATPAGEKPEEPQP